MGQRIDSNEPADDDKDEDVEGHGARDRGARGARGARVFQVDAEDDVEGHGARDRGARGARGSRKAV